MGFRPTSVVLVVLSAWLAACGAADNRVDPGDLALRDLLGLAPHVAVEWDEGQRAAARHVLGEAYGDAAAGEAGWRPLVSGRNRTERIARTLAVADGDRAGAGFGPVPLVRVVVDGLEVATAARAASSAATLAASDDGAAAAPVVELWLSPAWDDEPRWGHLPGRGLDVLSAFARDAGHGDGPVVVVPAPRLAVAAAYVAAAGDAPAEVLINPVVLAALEPDALEAATAAGLTRAPLGGGAGGADPAAAARTGSSGGAVQPSPVSANGTGGNPYSFYGSVAECAYVQRTRCEACLAASDCTPVTDTTDGIAECTMLAADSGRGYFLLCINLSLAIASVDACVADEVPACVRDTDAASKLAELANNAGFLDDATCATGLDACLADIYGAPPNPFPGTDGGTPTDPPRTTNVSCGDACDSDTNNGNVECSPSCSGGSGPSCDNAFSCDSACSSSNEQSGCGGNCEACDSSSDTGGSTSGGCGGCDSEGGSSGGGEACGSCDDSSSTGGGSGCGSGESSGDSGGCGSSGGGSGGGCGGGGCDSSSGGGGDGCGSGGGDGCGGGSGGSSGSCNVQRRGPPASVTLMLALLWGLLPLPAAALVRRRARRRRKAAGDAAEVTP